MRTFVTLSLFSVLALAACGDSSGEVIVGADGGKITPSDDAGSHTTPDVYTPSPTADAYTAPPAQDTGAPATPDTGIPPVQSDASGGTCPPATCTADSDCSCLGASGTIGCCDTVTKACFTSASTLCPDQQTTPSTDSGGGGY